MTIPLEVKSVPDRGLLLLQCASVSALQEALTHMAGLELPAPQNASFLGEKSLLWLAPGEWLLDIPAAEIDYMSMALTSHLNSMLAAVTDMSDAFAYVEVGGLCAAQILMTGCSLDLRAHAFPPGRLARTTLAHVPVIVWNPGMSGRFRCLIGREFAAYFRDWIGGCLPR